MQAPPNTSIVSPILIGRTSDLAALGRLAEQVRDGMRGPRVALIAGEAGVGKSRLVAEAQALAGRLGFHALQGNCFETDRALPYAPLLDMLRAFCAARPAAEIARAAGPSLPELARLLPELATLLPDSPSAPVPPSDPEQEKRRRFEALAQFLLRQAAPQDAHDGTPIVMIVEDLHWSDDASLEFLLFLARRIAAQPLLLALTYRSDEIGADLAHFLAGLDRERLAAEVVLSRLTVAEVDALIRAIFGQAGPVRAEFLDAVYGLTEGNPFFIEEILKALVAAGEIFYTSGAWSRKPLHELHIPRTVQDALQRRTQGLSEPARQVLTLAAVAGRRFDFTLLQHLAGHDERDLLRLIKELIAAQLVVEESDERFAFRHALTRQAVYAQLLARERKSLHRLIAETIEGLHDGAIDPWPREHPDPGHVALLAELAYHFYEAAAWEKALAYARRAGELAQRLYSPRAAREQFSRAIEAARHLALAPSPALYQARGLAHELLGVFEAARADYQQALAAARGGEDRAAECQSLLDLGFLWTGHDYKQSGDYLRRALDLGRAMGDPATLAQTLNRVGNWYANMEQPREALRCHEEALALFGQLGDRRGQAVTLDLLGLTNFLGGDLFASTDYYERAVAMLRELDDRHALASCLGPFTLRGASYMMPAMVWPAVSAARCIGEGEEAAAVARQIGWRHGEAFALMYLSLGLGPRGLYAQALDAAAASLRIAEEIEHQDVLAAAHFSLGALYLDMLALEPARRYTELALELAKQSGSAFLLRSATAFFAATCATQRDFAPAAAALDDVCGPDVPMQTMAQRLVWYARAELELAGGNSGEALQIVDRLVATATNLAHGIIPRLWYLRGLALLALGRAEEAQEALEAAQATARAQGTPPLLWRIDAGLARLHYGQGRRDQAEASGAAARATIKALAANLADAGLRETFVSNAAATLPRAPTPTPRQAAKRTYDGLTEREREVTALIARGKTNREIAQALVLSQRTVQVHITNILAKLDFTSRTQIATWAVEKGLIGRKADLE
jgi:DNA-binding CsgD family transcriptional regulator/tetratricopeptide (TPR) repeat protein